MVETCTKSLENHFMYFMVLGNHAPSRALGIGPRPLVGLYVGSSGAAAQRPMEPPARCTWVEPTVQNDEK